MARILILYGTNEGQTRKIAEFMATRGKELGHDVLTLDSASTAIAETALDFDGYVVGGSVHQGKHQKGLEEFVKDHRTELSAVPSAFFSVSLTAAIADPEHAKQTVDYVNEFLEETKWKPDAMGAFAGALLFTKYDFFKRLLMKFIARHEGLVTDTSRDTEYTNWGEVATFITDFLESIGTGKKSSEAMSAAS